MPDVPEVGKLALPGGNVNKPASGTYGEKASVDSLKKSLPQPSPGAGPAGGPGMAPVGSEPISVTPTPPGRPAGVTAPGVPRVLTTPTSQPGTPVNTPLSTGDPLAGSLPPVDDHFEGRLRTLDLLAQDPRVSPETREWAQMVRAILIGGDPA